LLEGTSLTLQAKPPPQNAAPPPSIPPSFSGSTSHLSAEGPPGGGKGLGAASSDWPGKKGIREGLPQHGAGGGVGSSGGMYRGRTSYNVLLTVAVPGNKGETFNVDT
jgi:hypothetical protein